MIVTIDGPAGSGKSTVARKLAARLGISYLDTGAMYRAIAHVALQRHIDFDDQQMVFDVAQSIELTLDCGPTFTRVRVDGQDVSEAIRTLAVSAVTPSIAKHPGIRKMLVAKQQEIGKTHGSLVTEGRDQGSVVFPDATVKIVLEATVTRRASRRYQELLAEGEAVELEAVKQNLLARDQVDAKQWEPLLKSGKAHIIDTTDLSLAEVIEQLMALIPHTPPSG